MSSSCLFCRIVRGEIPAAVVYRDEDVVAFKDIHPQAPFHVLVIPTRHVASLAEAAPSDAALLGKILLTGAQLAREAGFESSGFRSVFNAGPDAGQTVFHAHLHVLGGRPLSWPPG